MSDLGRRSLVAVVGIPVVATVIAAGARPSALLFGAAAAIACAEYYRLTTGPISSAAWVGIGAAVALPLAPVLLPAAKVGPALCGIVAGSSMLIWTIHLFAGPRAQAPERVGHLMAGLLFSSVGLVALSALRAGTNGVAWTAIVLVATSANDTAAYFGGRALGRNKLWPAVSPQKTWEGLVAGFVGGILALLIMRPWLPRYLGVDACSALGALVGVLAPLGDLAKSMLKRAYHVKDTGHLLPGHGGLLDRIDGVLFVAPLIWIVRTTLFSAEELSCPTPKTRTCRRRCGTPCPCTRKTSTEPRSTTPTSDMAATNDALTGSHGRRSSAAIRKWATSGSKGTPTIRARPEARPGN